MREVTLGMLDRFQRRYDSLRLTTLSGTFGLGRREQLKKLRDAMGAATRKSRRPKRKWDPHLKRRYRDDPKRGRVYFYYSSMGRRDR